VEEIVTGEAVVLDLPCARFPTRLLARLIDMMLQLILLFGIAILAGLAVDGGGLNDASAAAVYVTGFVLAIVGYPVIFETLSRGRTVGKLALGLRVVADDGGPARFRHALVRALAGAIECWALAGIPALITSMLSARGKRLGDIFAGTFVLRERAPRMAPSPLTARQWPGGPHAAGPAVPVDPRLQPWASVLDVSALPEGLAAAADSYLSRYQQLDPAARDRLGMQLASDIAARVSPPPPMGVPPAVFLYTVLAERRNRALAGMWAAQQAAWRHGAQPGVREGSPAVSYPGAPVPAAPPATAPPSAITQPVTPPPAATEPAVAEPEPWGAAEAGGFTPPA
jgi:uncharacterized RDD family membrane protein YckC